MPRRTTVQRYFTLGSRRGNKSTRSSLSHTTHQTVPYLDLTLNMPARTCAWCQSVFSLYGLSEGHIIGKHNRLTQPPDVAEIHCNSKLLSTMKYREMLGYHHQEKGLKDPFS